MGGRKEVKAVLRVTVLRIAYSNQILISVPDLIDAVLEVGL